MDEPIPLAFDLQRMIRRLETSKRARQNNNFYPPMNSLEMQGTWNIVKGKLKQKLARLTDDDLQMMEGKEDELIGRIQKRTSEARDSAPQNDSCPTWLFQDRK